MSVNGVYNGVSSAVHVRRLTMFSSVFLDRVTYVFPCVFELDTLGVEGVRSNNFRGYFRGL